MGWDARDWLHGLSSSSLGRETRISGKNRMGREKTEDL